MRLHTPAEKQRRHLRAGIKRPTAQVFVTKYAKIYEVTLIVGVQSFGLMEFGRNEQYVGGARRAGWYAKMLRVALKNAGARVR